VEEVSLGFFFRKKESLAKKLNRVTPSTTCVRNMLSTYIGNRAFEKNLAKSPCAICLALHPSGFA